MRSGYESKVSGFLDKSGLEYEAEKIKYVVPASNHSYLPDFKVHRKDGSFFYCESKGRLDARSRKLMVLVTKQNPDLDIRMLFQCNNKLSKTSNTRYTDWATKNGIICAVSAKGEIPEEWLE